MAIELFRIEWSKLYPIEEAQKSPEIIEGGVYARYRRKGSSYVLHYIGRSKEFSQRTPYHKRSTNQNIPEADRKKYFISFGIIYSFEKSRMSLGCTDDQLRIIERYFRCECPTDGNDQSTRKSYTDRAILIVNTGKVIKPFTKVMCHNPELRQILGIQIKVTTKKRPTSSSQYDSRYDW